MLKLSKGKAAFSPVIGESAFLDFWGKIAEGETKVQPFSELMIKYFKELVFPRQSKRQKLSIGFTFWDNDSDAKRANLVGGYGFDYRSARYPKRLAYGEGIVGRLLAGYYKESQKSAYVSCDYSNDPYLAVPETILETFRFQSGIALPVFVQNTLIGIFKLYCNVKLDDSVRTNTARLELEANRLSFLFALAETQFSATLRRRFAEKFQYVDIRIPEAGQEEPMWLLAGAVRSCLEETLEATGAVKGEVYLKDALFAQVDPTEDNGSDRVRDLESRQIIDKISLELLAPNEPDSERIGHIELSNKWDDTHFSRLDRRLLQVVAQALSKYLAMYLSLSNEAKTYHVRLDRQKHLLETSKSISLELVRTSNEDATVKALLESIKSNFSFSALVFLKAEKGKLVPYLSIPQRIASNLLDGGFSLNMPPVCVLADKEDWAINDCATCRVCKGLTVISGLRQINLSAPDIKIPPYKQLYADFGVSAGSELIIPIVAHDTLYGVLDMYRSMPGPIEENENYFLQSICNAAALSFHSRRLFDILTKIEGEENRGEMAREVVHTLSPITSSMMIYFKLLEKSVNSVGSGPIERAQIKLEAGHMRERLDNLREALRQQQNLIYRYRSASRSSDTLAEAVDLNEIIEDVIEINSNKAITKRITLKMSSLGQRRTIRAIRMDLYLILWNLLNNAIKFTRGGKPSTILIVERYTDRTVTVMVRDEGVGISDEDRPHIWELGFSTTAPGEKQHTSGVGLATVKNLVHMIQGGDIQVRSKLNSWSEFILTIAQEK